MSKLVVHSSIIYYFHTVDRAQLGVDDALSKDVREEPSISRKQMEESRQRLLRLVEDGYELVTNIRDATDAREGEWRTEEDEIRRQR